MQSMDKNKELFKEEAYDLLSELESSLMELEENSDDIELISRVFRAMHTIKGSGAMFGFDDISDFMHDIETVYDLVRDRKIAVTKNLINLTLSARDHITTMLDAYVGGDPVDNNITESILESFKQILNEYRENNSETEETPSKDQESLDEKVYRISFNPNPEIFMNGANPIYLLEELAELGECITIPHLDKVPLLTDINPEDCYIYWEIILVSTNEICDIKNVFMFVEDNCELEIEVVNKDDDIYLERGGKKLGEILLEKNPIDREKLNEALTDQKLIGEILVDSGLITNERVESALAEQSTVNKIIKKKKAQHANSTIRVPSEKLDTFVDLVGELVIIQQRLSQSVRERKDEELISIAEIIERLTVELRESAFSVRMLPIETIFSKLKRLVHDLSNKLGRDVDMITEGAETELDKTVIDQLHDPLVHIIRNSVDHGIEPPELRTAAGKPKSGTVCLSASHSGSNVLIKIKDDGKGMNPNAIKAKAIEKGIITSDTQLTKEECYKLTFTPGFSTAGEITSVSGRGVGMDVVQQAIKSLNGSIGIESELGVGTTITITLPLTLAIIEGLQVVIDNDYFVLPLSGVEECIELKFDDIEKAKGRFLAKVRGELVPYIYLREWFNFEKQDNDGKIVITRIGDRRVGFVVDSVIGKHQTVIKTLGNLYKDKIEGVSGATILGNGQVALILDIPQLINAVELDEKAAVA